jgi:hypothetical protein
VAAAHHVLVRLLSAQQLVSRRSVLAEDLC